MPCRICKAGGHNARTCNFMNNADGPSSAIEPTVDLFGNYQPNQNTSSDYTDDNRNNECIICYNEKDKNGCVSLKCGHDYCVDCFVEHMRSSNTCAYCRAVVCSMPKSRKKITPEIVESLYNNCFNDHALNEIRFDIYEQLLLLFNLVPKQKYITITNIHAAFGSIDVKSINGISTLALDVIQKLAGWYENDGYT